MPDLLFRPMPNFHGCRLVDPAKFKADSFRTMERDHDGKKYEAVMGRLKGKSTMTDQSYRYPVKVWSESDARAH